MSDPEMRRASIHIGQHQARRGSNPASTADDRRLEMERTTEQSRATRVRVLVASGTSNLIILGKGYGLCFNLSYLYSTDNEIVFNGNRFVFFHETLDVEFDCLLDVFHCFLY